MGETVGDAHDRNLLLGVPLILELDEGVASESSELEEVAGKRPDHRSYRQLIVSDSSAPIDPVDPLRSRVRGVREIAALSRERAGYADAILP